jgi:hypothetical protein
MYLLSQNRQRKGQKVSRKFTAIFYLTAILYLVSGRKLLISEAVRDVEGGGEAVNG